MIATAYTKPDKFIRCPMCGEGEQRVDHCAKGFKSAWYCDECGGKFHIEWRAPDQFILTPMKERKDNVLITLESKGPVRLLVKGLRFSKPDGSEDPKHDEREEYFYNEYTCPTNLMKNVERVIDPSDGDEDPHGIFAFVKSEPWRDLDAKAV